MNILLLAPQPFYTERGTPIAIYNLAKALGEAGHQVDLLAFPGGEDVNIRNTTLRRVARWLPFASGIPVGFSLRKLLLDGLMLFSALGLLYRKKFDVIHAVEESVFIALFLRLFSRQSQVIYDMDSSMSDQLVERHHWLAKLKRPLDAAECFAIAKADRVLAVCQALADKCAACKRDTPVVVVEDVADNAINADSPADPINESIRDQLPEKTVKLLYVGNLEPYQGVDLVVEAMAEAAIPEQLGFIVIGGNDKDIATLKAKCEALGVTDRVALLGPRPVKHLTHYLEQADILASPRTQGVNTPMKIYTYLGAGKPVIATNIASHTQVLNMDNACLVGANARQFAAGLTKLVTQPDYAQALARQAQHDAEERFSYRRFRERITALYAGLDTNQA